MSTDTNQLQRELNKSDRHHVQQNRTAEDRQQAWEAYLALVRDTDDPTNAVVEDALDKMIKQIYSARTNRPEPAHETEADAA